MLKFEAKKGDFAKIWQKLTSPQPSGSATHVSSHVVISRVQRIVYHTVLSVVLSNQVVGCNI